FYSNNVPDPNEKYKTDSNTGIYNLNRVESGEKLFELGTEEDYNDVSNKNIESHFSQTKSDTQWKNHRNGKSLRVPSEEDFYKDITFNPKYARKSYSQEIVVANNVKDYDEIDIVRSHAINSNNKYSMYNDQVITESDYDIKKERYPIDSVYEDLDFKNQTYTYRFPIKEGEGLVVNMDDMSQESSHEDETVKDSKMEYSEDKFFSKTNLKKESYINKERVISGNFKYHHENNDQKYDKLEESSSIYPYQYATYNVDENDSLKQYISNDPLENKVDSDSRENNSDISSEIYNSDIHIASKYSRQPKAAKIFNYANRMKNLDGAIEYKYPYSKSSRNNIDGPLAMFYDNKFDHLSTDAYRYPHKNDDDGYKPIKLTSGKKYVYGSTKGSGEQRIVSPLRKRLQLYKGHGHSRVPNMLRLDSNDENESFSPNNGNYNPEKLYTYFNDIKKKGPMNIQFADKKACGKDGIACKFEDKKEENNVHIKPICDINDHKTITTTSTTLLHRDDTNTVTTVTKSSCNEGTDITTVTKETNSTESNFYDHDSKKFHYNKRIYNRHLDRPPEKQFFNVHTISAKGKRRGRLLSLSTEEPDLNVGNGYRENIVKYPDESSNDYNSENLYLKSSEKDSLEISERKLLESSEKEITDSSKTAAKYKRTGRLLLFPNEEPNLKVDNGYTEKKDKHSDESSDDHNSKNNHFVSSEMEFLDSSEIELSGESSDENKSKRTSMDITNHNDLQEINSDENDEEKEDEEEIEIIEKNKTRNGDMNFCDDYSEVYVNHSAIILENDKCDIISAGLNQGMVEYILRIHNGLRTRVANGSELGGSPGPQPSAANMKELTWNTELAHVAQAWASQCSESHDCQECRGLCSRDYLVGQNIYTEWNISIPDWERAINAWYDEVDGIATIETLEEEDGDSIGSALNYVQIVWAETAEIGCGVVHYELSEEKEDSLPTVTYVCNYGPAAVRTKSPLYIEGNPASKCETEESKSHPGLCS
ncbi:unnamed protein product, partial [Meganyctiphanes norvegica]